MADQATIQTNIKSHTNDDLVNYALFLGGVNATRDVLTNYDPLITGYGRIFMVRKPVFLDKTIPTRLNKFKHILEYGNTAVNGLGGITVNTASMNGSYTGKAITFPTMAEDGTTNFTIRTYEFSGSPIREVLHSWVNGTNDLLTGLTHYNGASSDLPRSMANQTAEFIYVMTDKTGRNVEYACQLANCFPTSLPLDYVNYEAGSHDLVSLDLEFACVKYESIQINKVAKALLDRYRLLANSLNFYSGLQINDETLGTPRGYNIATGRLDAASANADTETPSNSIDASTSA